jgi:hypothetical protein
VENIYEDLEKVGGIRIGGRTITNLRYADDTVLLAESEAQLQDMLDIINERSNEVGMKLNVKKTKAMVISKQHEKLQIRLVVDGELIEQVDSYVYLGHEITDDGRTEKEIRRRIEMARKTFNDVKEVFTARQIGMTTKTRLVNTFVWSALLYGVETWTITSVMAKRIQAFEMWVYRRMTRTSWKDKIKNEEILRKVKIQKRLMEEIMKRKTTFCGHIMRHDTIQRTLLEGKVEGKRARGRQRLTWFDNIKDWTGRSYSECSRLAQDRRRWRSMAVNLQIGDDT